MDPDDRPQAPPADLGDDPALQGACTSVWLGRGPDVTLDGLAGRLERRRDRIARGPVERAVIQGAGGLGEISRVDELGAHAVGLQDSLVTTCNRSSIPEKVTPL